ncbi:MAG: hypothetical protein J7L95_05870 [Prolixibacteraceae bacterium]|nr:hypothetical protein [Prolixibacteraceae bacterium]
MNTKIKFSSLLLLLVLIIAGIKTEAEEKTKEYHESWLASGVKSLQVINKFGEVKVTNNDASEITIDVVITVDAPTEGKANELLDEINVSFRKSGNLVKAETTIDSDFKSRKKFSIDYTVNIPSDKNLNIANKYGNTFVNVLNANGKFDIQYGNFTANELNAPVDGNMNFSLAYGKADIGAATDMEVVVRYSSIDFGELDDLQMESKYSVISVEKASSIKADSKYDTFDFEEVESVTATTKYSHSRIQKLTKSLKIDAGYGGIKVAAVDSGFESISISNTYGQVSLGLGNTGYSVDASCEYCGISFPEDDFTGDKMKERNTQKVKGEIGSGNGGIVVVKSRYGKIKLNK